MRDQKKTTKTDDSIVWSAKDVRIQIKYGKSAIEIIGAFRCHKTGATFFRPKTSPPFGKARFLYEVYAKQSRVAPTLRISGTDREGRKYVAAHCRITRAALRSTSRGTRLSFELEVRGLQVALPERRRGVAQIIYSIPGLRGFHPSRAEHSDFSVHVHGEHDPLSFDHLTGSITLQTKRAVGRDDRKVLKSADALARRLLDLLSLAEGRWMRWSVRSEYVDGHLCGLLFLGPSITSPPRFEVFHFLNFDPIVRLAIERYDDQLRLSSGIDVAIEWMVSNPRYTEADILAMFVALEHLIYVHQSRRNAGAIPKQVFESDIKPVLRNALILVLRDLRSSGRQLTGEQEKRLMNGISQLKHATFREGLFGLIAAYSVPMGRIHQQISSIIRLRNDIVHKGITVSPGLERPLSFYAAICREVLVRIVLAILRYEGSYQSFLNGPASRNFRVRTSR